MRIAELIAYVKSLVPYSYYAYNFPATAETDASAVIIIGSGMPTEESGVLRPSMQILVRGAADDLENVETKAYELFDALKYKRDFMIGEASIVQLYSTQSAPLFTGVDENRRPIFSLNFMAAIRP
jgi:hypothetical protein